MDFLDLPTHQLILNDLAANLSDSIRAGDQGVTGDDFKTFLDEHAAALQPSSSKKNNPEWLSTSAAHAQISLARFASSIAAASRSTPRTIDETNDTHLRSVLNELIRNTILLSTAEIEESMATWDEWPLADELAFSFCKSLLYIASKAPQHRARCVDGVVTLARNLALGLGATTGDAHVVATRLVPMLHGLYRALSSNIFNWELIEFARLVTAVTPITGTAQTVQRLNHVLLVLPEQQAARAQGGRATRRKQKNATIRRRDPDDTEPGEADTRSQGSIETFFSGDDEDDTEILPDEALLDGGFTYSQGQDLMDDPAFAYRFALLSMYRRAERPLSGHFVLCSALEILSSVLAQALASHAKPRIKSFADYQKMGLRQDELDPARAPRPDRFDVDVKQHHDGHDPAVGQEGMATTKAWAGLHRYAVDLGDDVKAPTTNGTNGTNGGGVLASLPLIGSNGSAAFGNGHPESLTDPEHGASSALHLASRAYHDIQRFIESEGTKHSQLFSDVYALEILSEALKLGALASVAVSKLSDIPLDAHTVVRVRALLSESAVIIDPLLQGAALQSASILVRNFPSLVGSLTTQLRRFAASPQPMFLTPNGDTTPVLESAAKCLATCVTIVPGDDLAVSTMYALLNHLGRDTGGGAAGAAGNAGGAMSVRSGLSKAVTGRDFSLGHSQTQALFASRTEEEKQIINLSIIAMVSRLALEIGRPELTGLATSMLLQRLRSADDESEAAILWNIVPLALAGPKSSFVDVIRALTSVSRSAISGGANRRTGAAIQAAQFKLAQGLGALKEDEDRSTQSKSQEGSEEDEDRFATSGRKQLYLIELLQLFTEKGLAFQGSKGGSRSEQSEVSADLAGLLPAIAAVLSHNDINPQLNPTLEEVSLFRNMWFLSVIFGFADAAPESSIADSLATISMKTPTLVPETAVNYLESDLQYNSVLRADFPSATIDKQRKTLQNLIPSHSSELRSLGLPQLIFLATIYHLECTRSAMGRPSMILWYFVNQGLNTSSLLGSMKAIADEVTTSFISDLSPQVRAHSVDPRVSMEIQNLLLGSCHRVEQVRLVSRKILDRLFAAFPSLVCDQDVVCTLLEMLTLLRRGCEGQYRDEFAPVYQFHSKRANVSFELSDSYSQREEILSEFLKRTRAFLSMALARAPVELQSILQRYLGSFDDETLPGTSDMGKSIAIDYARAVSSGAHDSHLPSLGGWRVDASSAFVGELSSKSTYLGEMTGIHLALSETMVQLKKDPEYQFAPSNVASYKQQLAEVSGNFAAGHRHLPFGELRRLLYRSAAVAVALPEPDHELLHHLVAIPIRIFTPQAIQVASHVWSWIIGERPELETKVMVEIALGWNDTVRLHKGIFQTSALTGGHALLRKTEMSAFDREEIVREREKAKRLFSPHLTLLQLISSRFQAFRYRNPTMVYALIQMLQTSCTAVHEGRMTTHPLSRQVRFTLLLFGLRVVQSSRLDMLVEHQLRRALYDVAFEWFSTIPQFTYGASRIEAAAEMQVMKELLEAVKVDAARASAVVTSFTGPNALDQVRLPNQTTLAAGAREVVDRRTLLQLLIEDEVRRISVWVNPLGEAGRGTDFAGEMARSMTEAKWEAVAYTAWKISPTVLAQLPVRYKSAALKREAGKLIRSEPWRVFKSGYALDLLLEDHLKMALREGSDLKWLLYWGPVSPIEAIWLFQPVFGNNGVLLQYAMRTLEHHPVDLTFFYVPQVVQALRDDKFGYVEQFIFETSKVSQLFCHQILWNMKANSYQDDDGEVPDPMKPTLDRMTDLIVEALSGEAQDFYDREFGFFNEVTSISGKLKPFIKKSKPEKKAKIDEEMDKIKVDPGVYLPSNPDGVVVDLDRRSGRPLQSHAKAPFMATFKVHRDIPAGGKGEDEADEGDDKGTVGVDVWQSAIFKVGDDCRQDVLALQCIALFKVIYTAIGLDAYLYPYRVTATGPGCGVIDVVPNATSRDEMGRSKINSLLDFFVGKFGNVDSVSFQKARMNFIQSMAAYSVACHLLQCRDRHNGNIMINDTGHLVHIDFGFLFDIGPGGMHFEPYSFKLTEEFLDVMGGVDSQGFKMFSELCVKAFLAARPYARQIVQVCSLMMNTGLPSFKGQPTMDRFQGRFMLDLDERQAAKHMMALIKDGMKNIRSLLYDELQLRTNAIPYHK
ncbi:hypothetical protein BCV69DRAFT_280033 [Microstroma glucosiphilum]|uniref:1-phosphatidylinositol 4-kinase n=1 Tax=Pseudomicrostroma glucosiphilum TaxID=1684307 RepID=A0A316UIH3_9BASI|nr:hypothetical protein BCV69DRAFT_280033 [Pseudomicrostroma glucosiphilum]PWN24131.1 hypothetical protein BCV69DRAFT_280033 [Pseudomicrostroma glucosiphilum]